VAKRFQEGRLIVNTQATRATRLTYNQILQTQRNNTTITWQYPGREPRHVEPLCDASELNRGRPWPGTRIF